MSHVPIIHISHSASASAFYNNVCTPLDIRYLTSSTSSNGAPQHHYGIQGSPAETLFTLEESARVRPSTIMLSANSTTQVTAFHSLALASQSGRGTNLISQNENGAVAKTTDLDQNLIEVRYERSGQRVRRSSNGGGSIRSGHASRMERQGSTHSHREGTTITTASTAKEAKRVLEWQRTVARSVSESSDEGSPRALALRKPAAETVVSSSILTPQRRTPPPAAPSAPSLLSQALNGQQQQMSKEQQIAERLPSLMRAATAPVGAMTAVYNEITSALPEGKLESSGLSTNAIIGTIMGAAAGAAIAYAMVKSEEPEKRPELVTHFTAPAYQGLQGVPVQHQTRSVSMSEQGGQGMQGGMGMGHDMGHNMLQAMRSNPPPQPMYEEPAQYYSPSGLKAPSMADSGYSGSKVSRSEALRSRPGGGNSQSSSRVGSSRESSHMEENYSSSPKSTHSASPSHHSSRSKAEGSHVSKSSRHTSKPEPARAETVVSRHGVAKSSASTSRGSEASTVKPSKPSASKAPSKAPSAAYSEAKSSLISHTNHSRASEKSHGIGSVHSVKSEKSKHSSSRRAPESVVGSIAGTVVPEDSVSQVGSRHSSSRRRQEVY